MQSKRATVRTNGAGGKAASARGRSQETCLDELGTSARLGDKAATLQNISTREDMRYITYTLSVVFMTSAIASPLKAQQPDSLAIAIEEVVTGKGGH